MNTFNLVERKILRLIRSGKTKSDILAEKITTPAMVQNSLSNIYSKTEDDVKYKTARTKFEELACYLRNNPDAFGNICDTVEDEEEKVVEVVEEEVKSEPQGSIGSEVAAVSKVMKAIDRIITKLNTKLEILDEVKVEIVKELSNG